MKIWTVDTLEKNHLLFIDGGSVTFLDDIVTRLAHRFLGPGQLGRYVDWKNKSQHLKKNKSQHLKTVIGRKKKRVCEVFFSHFLIHLNSNGFPLKKIGLFLTRKEASIEQSCNRTIGQWHNDIRKQLKKVFFECN